MFITITLTLMYCLLHSQQLELFELSLHMHYWTKKNKKTKPFRDILNVFNSDVAVFTQKGQFCSNCWDKATILENQWL